eukprot:jgi/Hompol1/2724/HPOL_006149-RA
MTAAKVNPSWKAVNTLPASIGDFDIVKEEVKVAYETVRARVPALHEQHQPVCVIHVGVGLPHAIKLERLAHNDNYDKRDVDGLLAPGAVVVAESKDLVLTSSLDIDRVLDGMNRRGWQHIAPSDDPGRYVCDFIYYSSLYETKKQGTNIPCLFVHVPPVGMPYTQEELGAAINDIVAIITEQL